MAVSEANRILRWARAAFPACSPNFLHSEIY
jgi:hypothetical protein